MRVLAGRAARIILVLYLVTVAAICLYVPWRVEHISVGYRVIWAPTWDDYVSAIVDMPRACLELLAASALAGAAAVLVGTEKPKEGSA